MMNMDDINEFEIKLSELEKIMKQPGATDLIEVQYGKQFKRFYNFEIDKALDYFNKKKREGYTTTMKRVEG
jgi:hypothetical protein